MKVSAILVAATQAAPSSMHQWMVDNWWATAVETFNFASTNWEKFSAAVDGVRVKLGIRGYSAEIIFGHFRVEIMGDFRKSGPFPSLIPGSFPSQNYGKCLLG